MAYKHYWTGALLPLAIATVACGAEPATDTLAKPESDRPAPGFELRSESVRTVIRTAASTQMATDYRVETSKPVRVQPDIAAALRQDKPQVVRKESVPRLPERPPPCDGFWSCGLETLLGLEDFDDEVYARVQRDRLMNQGSFTDSSKINASVALPRSPGDVGPLRPR